MAENVSLNTNALIDFFDIKDYGESVSDDKKNKMNFVINAVSNAFDTYCQRPLKARKVWNEVHRNVDSVNVNAFPILKNPVVTAGS